MKKNYFKKLKECSGNSDIAFHFLNLFNVWLNRRQWILISTLQSICCYITCLVAFGKHCILVRISMKKKKTVA